MEDVPDVWDDTKVLVERRIVRQVFGIKEVCILGVM